MEFNLKKTSIGSLSTALDTVAEQSVDIDFTLPDYCPDIEKILRCKITPKIYNRNLSGGQLQIDGTTVVAILYVDSQNNNIRACEQSLPFNAAFQLKETPENFIIETSTKAEYVNCRALSQRRLTVHGAFSLYAKVMSKGGTELFSPDEIENIEFNTKEINCTALTAFCQEQFSAGDEIQINNKPPVEVILDSDVKANITDYKVIPDKLMLNGELSVRMLYLSNVETGEPQQIDYIMPFSRIIDCEGLNEDTIPCVSVTVMSFDIRLKSDILSESPIVDVDARLCVTVMGYSVTSVPIVLDAYSTDYVTELDKSRVTVTADTRVMRDSFMQKDTIPLDDTSISGIIDISNDYCALNPVITDNGITLNSKMNVCILALDGENNPVYIERTIEFSKEVETETGFNNIDNVDSAIASMSYRIGENNSLELRCEIKYTITVSGTVTYTMVTAINANEDNKVSKKNCALTLYYAQKGEKLWDIAKEYNTKQQILYDENALESDTLESPQMLLIPTV